MEIPTYTGEPLSALLRMPFPDVELWTWGAMQSLLPNNLTTIDQLTAQGYEMVPPTESRHNHAHLISQCCDVMMVQAGEQIDVWARSEDAARARKYPVTLACTLDPPAPPDIKRVYMLQFLPPRLTGEYGVVSTKDGMLAYYHISLLDFKAQQLWQQLTDALEALAAPFAWVNHTSLHSECASELNYQRKVTDLLSHALTLRGNDKQEIKDLLGKLEEAHAHVNALRQSWLKPDWLVQWTEIRRMAQDLAAEYFNHHEGNKPIPPIADVFNNNHVAEIFTAQPFQAYPAAAISRKPKTGANGEIEDYGDWRMETSKKQEDEIILSYRRTKKSGTTYIQVKESLMGREREVVLAQMGEQVKKLSDLDADVYLAMVAQMLKGIKDEQGNTWITAQQILAYRGIQPKVNKDQEGHKWNGGHRWEDIETIADCIRRMEHVHVKIAEMDIIDDETPSNKRKRAKRTISRESRLFMFGDTISHNQLPLDGSPGQSTPIAWQYRESSWMVPFLQGSNRFTGQLFQKVLEYDPYHQKWEKRLARHFVFWLRSNASREKKNHPTIGTLLNELNLDIDERFPQRTRDRFEKAMNRIMSDGILTWKYVEEFQLPPRKWFATWLQQQIVVEDPPLLKGQYAVIQTTAKVLRGQERATRKRRSKKDENA